MAKYVAARPLTLGGVLYNAGDTVTTTGWSSNTISTMIRMGWITVSAGFPSTPTDGYTVVYNAAQGAWVAVPPSGASELVYVANTTGTATALAFGGTSTADVPGVTFTIGPTSRPVYIDCACTFQQSVVGDGVFSLNLMNVTAGGGAVMQHSIRLPNTISAGVKTVIMPTSQAYRAGVLAGATTFKITAQVTVAGSVNVLNSASFPTWMRSYVL